MIIRVSRPDIDGLQAIAILGCLIQKFEFRVFYLEEK